MKKEICDCCMKERSVFSLPFTNPIISYHIEYADETDSSVFFKNLSTFFRARSGFGYPYTRIDVAFQLIERMKCHRTMDSSSASSTASSHSSISSESVSSSFSLFSSFSFSSMIRKALISVGLLGDPPDDPITSLPFGDLTGKERSFISSRTASIFVLIHRYLFSVSSVIPFSPCLALILANSEPL